MSMSYRIDQLEETWLAAMDTIERTLTEALAQAPDGQVAEFGDDARLLVRRIAMDAITNRAKRHLAHGESIRTIAEVMNVSENRLRYTMRGDGRTFKGPRTTQIPSAYTDLRELFESLPA